MHALLSSIATNVLIVVCFLVAFRAGCRAMWRSAFGDKYSPKHRR